MTRIIRSIFSLILLLSFTLTSKAATPISTSLAPMLQKITPAVVNIRAQLKVTDLATLALLQRQNQGQMPSSDQLTSVGSGVIVDAVKGYILTNAHVVDQAESVVVTLDDGHHYTAKVIGLDKASDIAVIQIQAKGLISISIGDSNSLRVGDFVAAIGNPFGLNQTVTSGIVSALGRTTLGIESLENFIQTDASINPGNSGGALVNVQGQLIGINTAILTPARGSIGIGFAIPSNMALSVMKQIIEYGNVQRGMLGIGAQDITPDLASALSLSNQKGAAVTQVIPNSPAEKAGLQVGDIIVSVNGAPIKNANDVVNSVGLIRVDSTADIKVLRNNKLTDLTTILTDPKKRKEISEANDPFLYGVALKNFSLLSPIHGDVRGVLVVAVDEDSNAWRSDLRAGDVIISANQQKIISVAELKKTSASSKDTLLLNVLRGSGAVFLIINKQS
jgi:serine protease Do